MSKVFAIVLAAGKGKRMKSDIPKVAHRLHEKTLLQWSIDAILGTGIHHIMVVISHNPLIREILEKNYAGLDVRWCYQDPPQGTGHAVRCGLEMLQKPSVDGNTCLVSQNPAVRPLSDKDIILVAYGDTPNIQSSTYQHLLTFHAQEKNEITIAAFYAKNPFGYGRVLVNAHGEFVAIREEKDCLPEEKHINLCHSGIMCANFEIMNILLPKLTNNNAASEFYLTDVIQLAKDLGYKVGFIASNHEKEFSGVNTPEQLADLETNLSCVE
jgi:bifunctional UDP-N-acetylglucosamine pyrophosphorylase/glucosamine-1-phosphate N-acetyltransferase